MKKFIYFVEQKWSPTDVYSLKKELAYLNDKGNEGWELCAVTRKLSFDKEYVYYFKKLING